MSKIDATDLVDIFKEEVTKKAKKELKKQKKKEKQLEKKENLEFEKLAKKHEEKEKLLEEKNVKKGVELTDKNKDKELSVFSFLYDTVFGFFLILLCLCTVGFVIFTVIDNRSIKTLIQVSLIGLFSLFYVISMTSKKEGIRKFASIISSIAICLFMVYIFYYA